MGDISTYMGNRVLNAWLRGVAFTPATPVYLSLHTASPGLTGANEVSGGGYARQAITFAAASSKSVTSSATVDFPTMPACNVSHLGIWDSPTGGNFYAGGPASTSLMYATVTASTDLWHSAGHGLAIGDRIEASNDGGAGLPGGITAGTGYYVIASGFTTDDFKVSTSPGGAATDITADGEGIVRKVAARDVGSGDTYEIAAGNAVFTLN